MNLLNRFIDKVQAFRVAKTSGALKELAEAKNRGASNTYVSSKERARKKKRNQIAKQSRRRNRK